MFCCLKVQTLESSLFCRHVNMFSFSSLRITVCMWFCFPAELWNPTIQVGKPTNYRCAVRPISLSFLELFCRGPWCPEDSALYLWEKLPESSKMAPGLPKHQSVSLSSCFQKGDEAVLTGEHRSCHQSQHTFRVQRCPQPSAW